MIGYQFSRFLSFAAEFAGGVGKAGFGLGVLLGILAQVNPAAAFDHRLAGEYSFEAIGRDHPACNRGSIGSVDENGVFAFTVKSGLSYYLVDGRFDEDHSWTGELVGRNRVPFSMRFDGRRIIATNLQPSNGCADTYIGTQVPDAR